ncbi:MAG: hypothetical protein ACTSSN_12380 [Candidatus Heimdallarchaeaceae archaeon]
MTDYTIKPYNESYIEKQVEIGNLFAQKWIAYGQSSVEQVKETYSRETFDPETRLYCFKGDDMVGYIGANIVDVEEEKIKRAQTRLAFVLPEHEGAFNLLFDQLVEVLKQKEVTEIETPQTILNDNYYEIAEKLGFSKTRTVTEIYLCDPSNAKNFETNNSIADYNHETDVEQVKKQLGETYPNLTGDNLENYVNRIAENENLLGYRVIMKDGEILAYGAATSTQNEGIATISLLIGRSSELKKHIISDLLTKINEAGFKQVAVYLNPETPVEKEEVEDFMAAGFEKSASYDILTKKL